MISKMNITSAKYLKDGISDENSSIKATIEGQELFVPLAEGNMHYDEIMRQVEAGELTIEEAD
tara:strand:+ start:273 stop:461 length:189 start_codon:yes stop_codon:yes gene_type:complete